MDRIKLETKHVSIEFPGVKALDDINFEVTTGEIRAVVGANGAGKSTLMKVLAGANSTYTGDVLLNGKKVEVRTPVDAKKLGIQIVYQEVDMALYPTLSVAENIVQNDMVMGKSGYIVNWKKAYKQGREALDRLHIGRDQVDEHELVQNLSLAQKQMVLIAKAIRSECNFLILDEPTAPLSNTETEELFRIVKHLHETENIAILFISHRLNEILEVCENYTVMRNGKILGWAWGAGFVDGIGQGVQTASQPSVGLGATASLGAGDVMKMGIGGGASTAAQTLSDYYIKRAEQYHPVIPIGAGNEVTVVFQDGFQLKTIEELAHENDRSKAEGSDRSPVPPPSVPQGGMNGFSTDQMLNQLGRLNQSQFMPKADSQ